MLYTVPHYYKRFRCAAGKCTDTCCAGWQIVIDERSAEAYRRMKGSFGNRVRNSIDWRENAFLQYDGKCAFLNEENLCDMYAEAGEKLLCRTCRMYPRHIEEYEGVREISLSMSCVEAAKLIFGCREPVRFLSRENGRTETYPEFDFFSFTKLMDVRECMLRLLQRRDKPIAVRMACVLALGHDMQGRMNRQELFAVDELLARYGQERVWEYFRGRQDKIRQTSSERYEIMRRMFGIFGKLEVLKEDWTAYIGGLEEQLFGGGRDAYAEAFARFREEVCRKEAWEIYMEQAMVYFLFTYFAGAVYDGKAYAKVQLAVVSTLLIQEMQFAIFRETGSFPTPEEMAESAHRYSKEIEHSDDNLRTLERLFARERQFSIERLMGVM